MFEDDRTITITYKNYKGLTGLRRITPIKIWYGVTAWYPEAQWLLTAFDHDKDALRDYALLNISDIKSSE